MAVGGAHQFNGDWSSPWEQCLLEKKSLKPFRTALQGWI